MLCIRLWVRVVHARPHPTREDRCGHRVDLVRVRVRARARGRGRGRGRGRVRVRVIWSRDTIHTSSQILKSSHVY